MFASLALGCGESTAPEPESIENIVASVNGEVLSAQEFERAIEALPIVLQERYREPAHRARYLDEYIDRRLVVQAAHERALLEFARGELAGDDSRDTLQPVLALLRSAGTA